jgi:o-succinylbenzoate---CoA ligase
VKIESKKFDNVLKIGSIEISLSFIENNSTFIEIDSLWQDTLYFIKDWISGKQEFRISTSGSTGTPKEIILSREQMRASALATAQALDLSASYHALVCLNTKYIAGLMMIVRALEVGMNMTLIEPEANPLKSFLGNERFDFTAVVPLQLENMIGSLPEKKGIFDHFKCIIVGGAQVSSALNLKISEVSVPVYATYGMTETVSHIALQRLNGAEKKDYFTALERVELRLNENSCLAIKSPATKNEWIQTNDIVELIDAKRFRYLGRIDNVINSGGVKVHPERVEEEVEKVLLELGITSRFFVFGVDDELLGQRVVLFLEGGRLECTVEENLLGKVKDRVDLYNAPKELVYVPAFLETATGKIDKRKIVYDFTQRAQR